MKPAPFSYRAPRTAEAAVADLAAVADDEGRILAGGQTLVPAMALRLARPAHLVDINRVAGFDRVAIESGHLSIAPCVRHEGLSRRTVPGALGELLDDVRGYIAHYPIRLRGTFCGSLANADPASEWCLVAVTLGARLKLRSLRGLRDLDADAFFLGYMTTALEPDEMLVEAQLPVLAEGTRAGFYEFSRRAGDFAQVMALATYTLNNGRIADARIGVGAIDSRPRHISEAETLLIGEEPGVALFEAAGEAAARSLLPEDSSSYRGRLAAAAVSRALRRTHHE
jgi:carbon-monoxide dehydrogenase medium subunit